MLKAIDFTGSEKKETAVALFVMASRSYPSALFCG
jgi:hypothetical protein